MSKSAVLIVGLCAIACSRGSTEREGSSAVRPGPSIDPDAGIVGGASDASTPDGGDAGECLPELCTSIACEEDPCGYDSYCPCPVGHSCTPGIECVEDVCAGGICQPASCHDGVHNGYESDADCGGPFCDPCVTGDDCTIGLDCLHFVCSGNEGTCGVPTCRDPTCDDFVYNGVETDLDCGGGCTPCALEQNCVADSDCASGYCAAVCRPATCRNNTLDGDETDVDCGGDACLSCAVNKTCDHNDDCVFDRCVDHICEAYSLPGEDLCTDGLQNGAESDIDCGDICASCRTGDTCIDDSDCASNICTANICEPSCSDADQNLSESDIDCGATSCALCSDDRMCSTDADCATNTCEARAGDMFCGEAPMGGCGAPADDCPAREKYAKERLAARKKSAYAAIKEVIGMNTNLMIIAEDHGFRPDELYADWIIKLKRDFPMRFKCLFIEAPDGPGINKALDDFQGANPQSWKETLGKWDVLRTVAPKVLAETARDFEIKIYAVDKVIPKEGKERNAAYEQRNKYMADKVRGKKMDCPLGLFIVGGIHVDMRDDNVREASKSIPQELTAAGYTTYKTALGEPHIFAFDLPNSTFNKPDHCKYVFDGEKFEDEFGFLVEMPGDLVRIYDKTFMAPDNKNKAPYPWKTYDVYLKWKK